MTTALYDDVVTVAPARPLKVVRDTDTFPARPRLRGPRRFRAGSSTSFSPAVTRWWTARLGC